MSLNLMLFVVAAAGILFFAAKFVFKNIKRGVTIVLVAVLAIWVLRTFIPAQWQSVSNFVQTSLGNLFK